MQADVQTSEATEANEAKRADAQAARERKIAAVIEEIRPALQRDGGDCELLKVEGSRVMVRLKGACMFCSLSAATLEGIQSRVVEELGELVRLIPVQGGLQP